MSRNYMSRNDVLFGGDYLLSNNREWKAVFQNDSNFVVYGWKPIWASNTWNSGATRLVMQADCNLVMYNNCDQPKWATDTVNNCKMCGLRLTDEGNLVLHQDGNQVWTSAKAERLCGGVPTMYCGAP